MSQQLSTTDCPCCTTHGKPSRTAAEWLSCPLCQHSWNVREESCEASYYEQLVSRNDTDAPWFEQKLADRAEALSPMIRGKAKRVLEIGCAEGLLGARLKSKHAVNYDGIELSRDAIIAATHLDHVFTITASNLCTDPYDLIVAFHVLEHIRDVASEIGQWLRLLAPGGRFVIEVPHQTGHPLLHHDKNREHVHQFSVTSIACLLVRCGLEIEQITRGHRESPVYSDSMRVISYPRQPWKLKTQQLVNRFKERMKIPFAVYGIGGDFENYILPIIDSLPVVALLDSALEKHGRIIDGKTIEAFSPTKHADLPLLVSSIRYSEDIKRHLRKIGIPDRLIVGLEEIYAPS